MLKQVLLDQLSEFLMVEQGGWELYRVAGSRALDPELKARYAEFGQETEHHREVLVRLIERLGGDPDYVSPTARVAQFKASKLLESSLVVGGLSDQELMLNDLENVLLAETKDQADWALLRQMAEQANKGGVKAVAKKVKSLAGAGATAATDGPSERIDRKLLAKALKEAVDAVGDEEEQHLAWAQEKHADMSLRMATVGPAPSPRRWQEKLTNPDTPLQDDHVAPYRDGLLEGSQQPQWQPSPITRSMRR